MESHDSIGGMSDNKICLALSWSTLCWYEPCDAVEGDEFVARRVAEALEDAPLGGAFCRFSRRLRDHPRHRHLKSATDAGGA
jgi:hypothetical protein